MKAYTVYQPYAYATVAGIKHYETRPRRTSIRGRVAVHAAKKRCNKNGFPAKLIGEIAYALNVDDTDPAERALSDDDFSIIYGGTELKPLKTRNGIIFIQQKYIAPLEDVLDVVQLYERVTPDGQTYIAAKAGLLIAAVIFPYSVINEKFVKRLEEVARESRRVLNEPPPVRMAERDPDQGDMFAE